MCTVYSEFTTIHIAHIVAARSIRTARVHKYTNDVCVTSSQYVCTVYSEFTTTHVAEIVTARSIRTARIHNYCVHY